MKPFTPDPGFETRWTRGEREHQLIENIWIGEHCPVWGGTKWGEGIAVGGKPQ